MQGCSWRRTEASGEEKEERTKIRRKQMRSMVLETCTHFSPKLGAVLGFVGF